VLQAFVTLPSLLLSDQQSTVFNGLFVYSLTVAPITFPQLVP
jgi:hypothetical protein